MCNYCGCRATEVLARLTDDHEQLLNLRGELTRAVRRGDFPCAAEHVRTIAGILAPHNRLEELTLYPALLAVDGYRDRVSRMFDEHDDIDAVLQRALAASAPDPGAVDWAEVQAAIASLAAHIDAEEHGLFPAAAVSLDPSVWNRADDLAHEHPL